MNQYPLITIVGGSGFVGRHVVKLLASKGYRIRVLVRDTIAAEFLKTCATVGSIVIEHADITRPETLSGKLAGSDAVVSLVSIMYQSGRQKFDAINIEGAKAVAAEAKRAGAKTLIHISGLGIEHMGSTAYGRTKLAGEQAVREAFPEATILRPSLIVGPEDGFFQRFARMALVLPFLPLIGGGKTRFQPVLVTDVAQAIAACIAAPGTHGKTFELAGPKIYSFRELLELMRSITKRRPCLLQVPFGLMRVILIPYGLLWFILTSGGRFAFGKFKPAITRDQVKLLAFDSVQAPNALSLSQLGITAAPIESALPQYLSRFVKE